MVRRSFRRAPKESTENLNHPSVTNKNACWSLYTHLGTQCSLEPLTASRDGYTVSVMNLLMVWVFRGNDNWRSYPLRVKWFLSNVALQLHSTHMCNGQSLIGSVFIQCFSGLVDHSKRFYSPSHLHPHTHTHTHTALLSLYIVTDSGVLIFNHTYPTQMNASEAKWGSVFCSRTPTRELGEPGIKSATYVLIGRQPLFLLSYSCSKRSNQDSKHFFHLMMSGRDGWCHIHRIQDELGKS